MRVQQRKPNIVTRVPREGAPRIPPSVAKVAKKIAQDGGVRLDVSTRTQTAVREMESASDWNSLLLTARAQRGPQWDVCTQQFLIDKGSSLYFDPSALIPTDPSLNSPSLDPPPLTDSSSMHNLTVPPSPAAFQRTPSGGVYRDLTPGSFSIPQASSRSESLAPSERRRRTGRSGGGREGMYQY